MLKPLNLYTASLVLMLLLVQPVQAKTFKMATVVPDGTVWMEKIRAGADKIAKETQDRVKFKFYTGGVMGSDKSVLKKIRIGQLHGGALTGGGLANIYPDSQLYSLPFMFSNLDEVDYVRKAMDPLLKDGLQKQGIRALGISEGGFVYFMSVDPVRSIEDLARQKNWVPEDDVLSQAIYESVHIAPIPLSLSDVYTGLQTGLVNSVGSSPTGAIALQWHTKLKYVTNIPMIYIIGTLVMDEKAFATIAPTDQQIVTRIMGEVFTELNQINRDNNMQALAALKQQGLTFLEPTAQETTRWHAIAADMIRNLGNKGIYTSEMLNRMQALLQQFRKTPAK